MVRKIALFNHKGGASKTTTTFYLGWMLAAKGKRVVLVDADPQCNLTSLVLDYKGDAEIERLYESENGRNLKSGLEPAFTSSPILMEPVECFPVSQQQDLFLLPGHIGLSEYEVTLGIAQDLSASTQIRETLQNSPGSISYFLEKTAERCNADYILIDMNPSLSPFNQNLLMTSHFFIVPATPDYFSVMAINSLANVIPRWRAWAEKARSLPVFRDAVYPFPDATPKFLGTVVQKNRPRGGVPDSGFQKWIDEINETISETLAPKLGEMGMMLPEESYAEQHIDKYCLATIPDFDTLIAKSHEVRVPVFSLSNEQIGQSGKVLEATIKSRDRFNEIFSELADKVIGLTGHASGD